MKSGGRGAPDSQEQKTSEEDFLDGGVGVEPSSVWYGVWARGERAGEAEYVAKVGQGGGELDVWEKSAWASTLVMAVGDTGES